MVFQSNILNIYGEKHMMQQWFKDAKLGISLHWGIYSVNGTIESWPFFNHEMTYDEYMSQLNGFTAKNYNPKAWAELFDKAGAKYAVLTAKHHDGVALWDTKLSDLSVVKKTPAKRDLVKPYCDAMREAGLKVGLYFSHLDWSHPDYRSTFSPIELDEMGKGTYRYNEFRNPPDGKIDIEKWERFLAFHKGQLKELMTNFETIDMFTFDGDWERTKYQWKMEEVWKLIHQINPNVVLNSRICDFGDFDTPEQGIPLKPSDREWEFWFTVNDSWGYRPVDKNYKSTRQMIRMFGDCIGMGGNVLINIAPMADGTIDPEQEKRLIEFGNWLKPNSEAVYSTIAGLPLGHFSGASTLSKDRKNLYLFYYDKPLEMLPVKGIHNQIKSVSILKNNKELKYKKIGGAPWLNIPGILWIDLPEADAHNLTTVIKIELEEELRLYTGSGAAITAN